MRTYLRPIALVLALLAGLHGDAFAQMRIDGGGVPATITGNKTFTGLVRFPDGTAALTSIAQASDPDNGIFFGTNQVRFSTAGTERWTIGATGVLTGGSGGDIALAANAGISTNGGGSPTLLVGGFAATGNSTLSSTLTWNSRFSITAGGSTGLLLLRNNAETAGVGFDVTTDAVLKVRTRAHSAYADVDALGYQLGGVVMFSGTAPTTPVACTSPTVTNSNGSIAFQVDVGTSCTGVTTLVVTMPAATNAWAGCIATHINSPTTRLPRMTASTTTSITFTNFDATTGLAADWSDGNDVRVGGCVGG